MTISITMAVIIYIILALFLYKIVLRLATPKARRSFLYIFTLLAVVGTITECIWGPLLANRTVVDLPLSEQRVEERVIIFVLVMEICLIMLGSAIISLTLHIEFPMIFVIKKKNGQTAVFEKRVFRKSRNCIVDMNQIVFNFKVAEHFNSIFLKEIRVRVHFYDDFLIQQYKMVLDADIVPGTTLSIEKNRPVVYKAISDLLLRDIILNNIEDLQNGSAKELEKYPLHNSNFLFGWSNYGIQASSVKDIQLSIYPKLKTQEIVLK